MATDGPDPPPCDPEIWKNGTVVFITHTIPSNAMEGWVKMVKSQCGQPVDWSFMGGRAVVRALGDINRVCQAIFNCLPTHDLLFALEMIKLDPELADQPPPRVWGPGCLHTN